MISIERRTLTLTPDEDRAVGQVLSERAPAFFALLNDGLATTLVTQPFFRRHRIVELEATGAFPARSMVLALPETGAPRILSAALPALNKLAGDDPPPRIDGGGTARIYANLCDEWTTESEHGELVIDSLEEIPWFDDLDPAEQGLVARLRDTFGAAIGPLEVEATASGWDVTKWLVASRMLVRRRLSVASTGHLLRQDVVYERALPVAHGLVWGVVQGRLVPVG